jgi:hypothetical protein
MGRPHLTRIENEASNHQHPRKLSEAVLLAIDFISSLDLVSYNREISLAGMQDFLRCKPRITPMTLSIFPEEHEPSLTYTTA